MPEERFSEGYFQRQAPIYIEINVFQTDKTNGKN